jgi:hypothetical protein
VAEGTEPEQRRSLPPAEPSLPILAKDGGEDTALSEARQLSSGKSVRNLKKDAEESDHERGERFRDNFETITICAINAIFAAMAVLGIVWLAHMVLPEKCSPSASIFGIQLCRWLIPEQVIIIQDVLTGGIIAGLIGDHIKRRMTT